MSRKEKSFCSWSGGKDSCLSLYHAQQSGYQVDYLLCMLDETGLHSRAHRIPKQLLQLQADSLGIPIVFGSATWEEYESRFLALLSQLSGKEIRTGIFGDIDIAEHRQWVERVCQQENMTPILPLWKSPREQILSEFLELGFRAVIVSVNAEHLEKRWLGKTLEPESIVELKNIGIDASGEQGEYHTFVYDCSLFRYPVSFTTSGILKKNGYLFLDINGA